MFPLKTSENQIFFDVFRGIKREYWNEKGQTYFLWDYLAPCQTFAISAINYFH